MKSQFHQSPRRPIEMPKTAFLKFGIALLMLISGFTTSVMAGGDQVRNILPGINTFAEAIESNPGLKYDIRTWQTTNLIGTRYVIFSYRELVFEGLGITLTSQEIKGEKFPLRKSKTQIMKVRIENPAKVQEQLQELLPEMSQIPFPEQSLAAVEQGLGKATQKSTRHLRYDELGYVFYFFKSKGSEKMDRIRTLFLLPVQKKSTY